jgi:hypothetical protein
MQSRKGSRLRRTRWFTATARSRTRCPPSLLLRLPRPPLNNSVVLTLDPADFAVNVATPGLYQVSIVGSPVATQTCTYPVFLAYGDGAKVLACVSGPAPGTAGGAVLLGVNGTIPTAFLPSVFESRYRGLYNAQTNTPALATGDCTAQSAFYYTVSVKGNVTLGSFFALHPRDLIVCFEGTWTHVGCVNSAADSFEGRFGNVVPQLGDYTPDLIPFNNGTLDDLRTAPVVLWSADAKFPNGLVLTVEESELSLSNATIGLFVAGSQPPNGTFYPGFIDFLEVDRHGLMIDATSTPTAVQTITGAPNQIIASAGPDVVLSLPQDYHTGAQVRFGSLGLGAGRIVSASNASINFPQNGFTNPVYADGAQAIFGNPTLTVAPTAASDKGLHLRGPGNVGSSTIHPSPAGTGNLDVFLPPTGGNPSNVMMTNGAGQMSWERNPNMQWTQYTPTVTPSANVVSVGAVTAYFLGSLTPGSLVEVIVYSQITRSIPSATTSIDITVPTGVETTLITAARGLVTEPTPTQNDFYGYVRQGFGTNDVRLTVRGSTAPANGYWFSHFFYEVQ